MRWLIAACALLVVSPTFADQDEAPLERVPASEAPAILERARAALVEHQTSVQSVRVKYTVRLSLPPGEASPSKNGFLPFQRLEWAKDGRKLLEVFESGESDGSPAKVRGLSIFDGERGYAVGYHNSDLSKVDTVRVIDGVPESLRSASFPATVGWQVMARDESLSGMLAKPAAKVLGRRRVGDAVCYEIEAGTLQAPGVANLVLIACLDPQAGWLPRRLRVIRESAYLEAMHAGKLSPVARLQSEILSFQQVEDRLFGVRRWYPKEVRVDGPFVNLITVEQVSVNEPLPPSLFAPEIQEGTKVEEQYGTSRYRATFHGGAAGQSEHERMMDADRVATGIKKPADVAATTGNLIDAVPDVSSRTSVVVLCFSAAALAAAGGVWLRRRRKS